MTTDIGLHAAARRALDVLIVIRDYDQDSGIADPDVEEAIEALEVALERRREQKRASRKRVTPHEPTNRWGFKARERLRVREGRYAGALVRYAGTSNSTDIYIEVDGTQTTIRADHVERIYP